MRRYETRTRTTTTTSREVAAVECDLCGRQGFEGDFTEGKHSAGWTRRPYEPYEIDAVAVYRTTGTHYPEDDRVTQTERFDVCPDCWTNKVVAWFATQGVTPQEHDSGDDEPKWTEKAAPSES